MVLAYIKVFVALSLLAVFIWLGTRKPGAVAPRSAPQSAWQVVRAFIAIAIVGLTCVLPWWLLDPGDKGHQGVMYLSMLWMPVVLVLGVVFAWMFLAMTREK